MRLGLPILFCAALLCVPVSAASAAPQHPSACLRSARRRALLPDGRRRLAHPDFDGVPLDVDVWLPPPATAIPEAVVMLHAFGGSKRKFHEAAGCDAIELAQGVRRRAAVRARLQSLVRRAGLAHSRCERGRIHLDDQRYEARDVQWLLAKLVDSLVARPDELGVDRHLLRRRHHDAGSRCWPIASARPNGVTESWQSPDGVPLHIHGRMGALAVDDLAGRMTPNEHLGLDLYASPVGVVEAYVDALYALADAAGFVAPLGADPARTSRRGASG